MSATRSELFIAARSPQIALYLFGFYIVIFQLFSSVFMQERDMGNRFAPTYFYLAHFLFYFILFLFKCPNRG